jgi:SAM-dependent methyltransferase
MASRLDDRLSAAENREQTIPCIALPEPNLSMEQDAEWCVIRDEGQWREIRFHDYDELYLIPGLYERLFYDILKCNSPTMVRKLLERKVTEAGQDPANLRVFDLGAGNGMVGEELADMGVEMIVGVDIIEEAAIATERDRPGIYEDYFVHDLTDLSDEDRAHLARFNFNTLCCVAALGFGDIPPVAFAEAYNLITGGGWIAFNIKENFLNGNDISGFSTLIRRMIDSGRLDVCTQRRYQHRIATNGDPLYYMAVIGRKHGNIPADWVE